MLDERYVLAPQSSVRPLHRRKAEEAPVSHCVEDEEYECAVCLFGFWIEKVGEPPRTAGTSARPSEPGNPSASGGNGQGTQDGVAKDLLDANRARPSRGAGFVLASLFVCLQMRLLLLAAALRRR